MARGLKFRIQVVEGLYYLCSENKDAVFAYAKSRFSHNEAHVMRLVARVPIFYLFYFFLFGGVGGGGPPINIHQCA